MCGNVNQHVKWNMEDSEKYHVFFYFWNVGLKNKHVSRRRTIWEGRLFEKRKRVSGRVYEVILKSRSQN
jgi:hypothetical protein